KYNQLSKLDIPNSVNTIGEKAFANNNLNKVSIGYGIKQIGNEAFFNNKLTQENTTIDSLRKNVTLGQYAFSNNGSSGTATISPYILRDSGEIENDKTSLENAVKNAKQKQDNYTEETKRSLEQAIERAELILNNDNALQEEVNEAIDNLTKAIDQLVENYPET